MKNSDTFCYLPWTSLYMDPEGRARPCCEAAHTSMRSFDKNILNTLNNPKYIQLRKDLANGVKNKECNFCWYKEERGDRSLRQTQLKEYRLHSPNLDIEAITNDDYSLKEAVITYLDIRSSNLCNYKCRFCSPVLSNSWVPIWREMNPEKAPGHWPPNGVIEYEIPREEITKQITNIRAVNLAGGEPVLMPGTYWLLEEFIKHKSTDINLSIISNTSRVEYGDKKILDLLKHFPRTSWTMSIDAIGERHAYLRSGINDWDKVYKNSQKIIDSIDNTMVFCSVSWLNLYAAYDVFKLYHDKVQKVFFNIVLGPDHFAITALPQHEIDKAVAFYEEKYELHQNEELKKIIRYLKTAKSEDLMEKAMQYHNQQDKIRGQKFSDSFPEWSHLFPQKG